MLLEKIKKKEARIGVIGLGYVGLPLIIGFGRAGFKVTGLDVDQTKVDKLSRGESYISHIPADLLKHGRWLKLYPNRTLKTIPNESSL